jgi:hypothetical protein
MIVSVKKSRKEKRFPFKETRINVEEILNEIREAVDYLVQADAHKNPSKAWDCVDAARGILVSLKLRLQSGNKTRGPVSEEQIENLKYKDERLEKKLDEEILHLEKVLKQDVLEIKKTLDGFSQRLYELEQFRSSQGNFSSRDPHNIRYR